MKESSIFAPYAGPPTSLAPAPKVSARMICDIRIEDPRWEAAQLDALTQRAAQATLAHLDLTDADYEIAVLGCNDATIAQLNAEFRGKPTPTNVLSWPAEDLGADTPGATPLRPDPSFDPALGDIAIAFDTCKSEAEAAQKPLADHVSHLIVHGLLHLLGYDHISDADAAVMEALEIEILGKLGLDDPYS